MTDDDTALASPASPGGERTYSIDAHVLVAPRLPPGLHVVATPIGRLAASTTGTAPIRAPSSARATAANVSSGPTVTRSLVMTSLASMGRSPEPPSATTRRRVGPLCICEGRCAIGSTA